MDSEAQIPPTDETEEQDKLPEIQPDGIYESDSGSYHIVTTIKSGAKNGIERVFENKNLLMESYFENDVMQGPLSIYDIDTGQIQSRAFYKEGLLDGEFTAFNTDGSVQLKMSYIKGEKNGKTSIYGPDSEVVQESNYLDGKLHGEEIMYHDGEIFNRKYYENGVEVKDHPLQYEAA
jgi:uncharacterized protein